MGIFNQQLLKIRKNRIATTAHNFNFLRQELAQRTADRLLELQGSFPNVLEIGCGLGELSVAINQQNVVAKIPQLWQSDYSLNFLKMNPASLKINLDPNALPIKANSFNGVISIFALQHSNDVLNVLSQIYNILKPKGFFFVVMPISGTLQELKTAMADAEMELFNGQSPHIHPFLNMQTIANLFQEVGFQAITADKDKIEIMYKQINTIYHDIKGYGEANILLKKSPYYLGKKYFELVAHKYKKYKDTESNHYPVSVEYCNIIGWKG